MNRFIKQEVKHNLIEIVLTIIGYLILVAAPIFFGYLLALWFMGGVR